MPTQNVNLSGEQARFIRQRVKGGGYRNASEVVRAGLRLLEQREGEDELKLERLRRLASESFAAIDRGEGIEIEADNLDAFIDGLSSKSGRRRTS